jgi:hypothetical protein
MARREYSTLNPTVVTRSAGDVVLYQWTGMLNGDYGAAIQVPALADRSVQILGTLGTGGSVRIHGSNKPAPVETTDTDWAVLTDPQGNDLNIASLKAESITEPMLWIRPKVTAGDGTTNLTIIILFRK